jgi:hypothetical protein
MIKQVEVYSGLISNYAAFRDDLDIECGFLGRRYSNLSDASWGRLLRAMSDSSKVRIELVPDGTSMEILGWRIDHEAQV